MKIVFCHNVYTRYATLIDTINIEKTLLPDSISIVAYNDAEPPDHLKKLRNVEFIPFHGKTHKIGCTNGCITSIQAALKYNPDMIVFSHDDVMISDKNINVFNNIIMLLKSKGFGAVCRRPSNNLYGENYYMMECFFITPEAARTCFGDLKLYDREEDLPKDIRGSQSPEVFLHDVLNKANIMIIDYDHKLEGYNDTLEKLMGFTHLNAGIRGWQDK